MTVAFAGGLIVGAAVCFGLALMQAAKTPQDLSEVGTTREPAQGNSLSPDQP